jgi:putative redox protein
MPDLQVAVRFVAGVTSVVGARSHSVVVDRPAEKGGNDLGFLGGELFLAGVGGCFMSTLAAAAKARNIAVEKASVVVRGVEAQHPSRFSDVQLEVELETNVSVEETNKLIEIAERGCTVYNTLRMGVQLTVHRGHP